LRTARIVEPEPEGHSAGVPKHDPTGRILDDEGLAGVPGRDFEQVAAERYCLHVLEQPVVSDDEPPPRGGVGVNLAVGVVVGDEHVRARRAGPRPYPEGRHLLGGAAGS
jgi:hypothetical protein